MGLDADRSSSMATAKSTLSTRIRKRTHPLKFPICPDPFLLPNLLDGFDESKYGKIAEDIKRLCDMKRRILNPYFEGNSIYVDNEKKKSMERGNLVKPPSIVILESDDELPETASAAGDSVNRDPNLNNLEDYDVGGEVIILEDDDCANAEILGGKSHNTVVAGDSFRGGGVNMVKVDSETSLADVSVADGDLADNSRDNIEEANDSDDDCTIAELLARKSHKKVIARDNFRCEDVNMGKVVSETTLADLSCLGGRNGVDVSDGEAADSSEDNIAKGNHSDVVASSQISDVEYSAGNSIDSVGRRHSVVDGEDDLWDIWTEMAFALESSKETLENPSANEHAKEEGEDCHHSFIHKDDLGEVCRVCGLVQRHIGSIIEVVYNKPKKSTRTYVNESHYTKNGETSHAFSNTQISQTNCLATKIAVHPRHQNQMRPHQIEGFNFLCNNLVTDEPGGCILAHAPGSGKTFLVISFMQSFMAKYPDARPLIVLPRGIIETWKREFILWQVEDTPLLDFYSAKAESRAQQVEVLRKWVGERSIMLLGYKQFSSIICDLKHNQISAECQEILLKVPTVLILDEGHTSRNEDTDVLSSLARVETPRKVVLSGTLFQNHVKEVFNILNLVRPKFLKLPNSRDIVTRIMSKVEIPSMRKHVKVGNETAFFDGVEYTLQKSDNSSTKVSVIKDLREMTHQVLHYHKADFRGELPGLLEFTVMVNLTTLQSDEVKRLRKLDKFKQISLGSALYMHPKLQAFLQKYPSNGERGSGFDEEKVDKMLEKIIVRDGVKMKFFLNILGLCDSTGEKLLVFSQYILPLKALERLLCQLKGWRLGKELFTIIGDSNTEQREWSMERFNTSPDAKVFFGSIKACGEGISLVGASRVLILDVHLNPSVTQQAIARAYRPGQKKKVYAYRLVAADSPEEEDYSTCLRKELISKMWFEWNEGLSCEDFGLKSVDVDDSGDAFLETAKIREDIKALYKR